MPDPIAIRTPAMLALSRRRREALAVIHPRLQELAAMPAAKVHDDRTGFAEVGLMIYFQRFADMSTATCDVTYFRVAEDGMIRMTGHLFVEQRRDGERHGLEWMTWRRGPWQALLFRSDAPSRIYRRAAEASRAA